MTKELKLNDKTPIKAVGYLRTSSAANVGTDKDSDKRQKAAISGYAAANGFKIVDWYYDAAVSGADPVNTRPGFSAMFNRLLANGCRTVIVESPDRFARDLMVQLVGHDRLKAEGIALIPASAPDFFTHDTPTAVLVRQVLGAIFQFEKATTVAKLAAARKRKRESNASGKCEGRKSILESNPDACAMAKILFRFGRVKRVGGKRALSAGKGPSLRGIAAQMASKGLTSSTGRAFTAKTVATMIASAA